MLQNFILPPHSWTWCPVRFEAWEWNTSHTTNPGFQYAKKKAHWRVPRAAGIVTYCCDAVLLEAKCLFLFKVFLTYKSAIYVEHYEECYTLSLSRWSIAMISNVYSIQGTNILSSFDVQGNFEYNVEFIAKPCWLCWLTKHNIHPPIVHSHIQNVIVN